MKDSLFDILLNFFEKTLSQIKNEKVEKAHEPLQKISALDEIHLKTACQTSIRVFIEPELARLTKPSYQFLIRIIQAKLIHPAIMEQIINSLIESNSRYVSLEETKWTLRNKLAAHLSPKDLAFLDLVLYQKEDELSVH